jgi:isoleucyl-tRNA synthetase
MWSPVEKTALAEAEVEYEDIVSTQIDVAFEITECPNIPELVGAFAVIWTTTPWTIPVNQALAYGPDIEYVLVDCWLTVGPEDTELGTGMARACERAGWFLERQRFLVAADLLPAFAARLNRALEGIDIADLGIERLEFVLDPATENADVVNRDRFKGSELAGTVARHPMHHLGGFFAEPRPFLPGDFVTTDSGTGLVHMAPDHGEDDFELCKAHGITPKFVVEADGRYRDNWLWLPRTDARSMSVINPKFNAPDGPVCADLREAGALLAASADYRHSYPHSWRSKAKVIFRCTPQWFVPMDTRLEPATENIPLCEHEIEAREESQNSVRAELVEAQAFTSGAAREGKMAVGASPQLRFRQAQGERTLREVALSEIDRVRFVPEKGRNRIGAMVAGRPDWVLSRQRAWGVPITLFVDKRTGEYLVDPAVNARIVAAVRAEGVDAWSDEAAQALLGPDYKAEDYERIADILDVWFDSGSTHAFVLESGRWPDLKWPADLYLEGSDQHRGWFQSSLLESCATRGRAPYDAVLTHGFTMDAKGEKMSKSKGNTTDPLKVMETYGADIIRLWALSVDYTEDHRIGDEILKGVADQYRKLRNTFRYLLGALDGFEDGERLPVEEMPELERYVLALLGRLDATLRTAVADFDFNTYTRTLTDFCNEDLSAFFFDIRKDSLYCDAPMDPRRRACRTVLDTLFHALIRYAAPVLVFTAEEVWGTRYPDGGSVHLLEWPQIPSVDAELAKWADLRGLRQQVTEAIEPLRRDKLVRSSLEAEVVVPASAVPEGVSDELLAELFISGAVSRGTDDRVGVRSSDDHKCGRCWRLLPEVPEDGDLCARCAEVVEAMDTPA